MRKAIQHLAENPFILLVAVAALIHSTWSVSIMFNGFEPSIADILGFVRWVWWMLPGFMFAVALDVGQIVSAYSIRQGSKSRVAAASKLVTFAIMAAFSYALQLIFLLHHIPALSLGEGLSPASQIAARTVLELCAWLIPGMLPLSIVLYTLTDAMNTEHISSDKPVSSGALTLVRVPDREEPIAELSDNDRIEITKPAYEVECDHCEWAGAYQSQRGAINALNAHKRTHDKVGARVR